MPTYDYECDACGHKVEIFQGINDAVVKKCPQCKKNKFRRLFGSGAAIVFKGSGFYQTDYRSESYKKSAAADKSTGDSKSSSDSKTSGDSKPSSESKSSESKPSESKSESKPKAESKSKKPKGES